MVYVWKTESITGRQLDRCKISVEWEIVLRKLDLRDVWKMKVHSNGILIAKSKSGIDCIQERLIVNVPKAHNFVWRITLTYDLQGK